MEQIKIQDAWRDFKQNYVYCGVIVATTITNSGLKYSLDSGLISFVNIAYE